MTTFYRDKYEKHVNETNGEFQSLIKKRNYELCQVTRHWETGDVTEWIIYKGDNVCGIYADPRLARVEFEDFVKGKHLSLRNKD